MASSTPSADGFHLLSLHPTVFGKIISKLKGEEYFRLRRTCHAINDLIQKNRALCIHLDADFTVEFTGSPSFPLQLFHWSETHLDVEAYSGARFGGLWPPHLPPFPVGEAEFQDLYQYLKKNRITCVELHLGDQIWTKEQCAVLLKLLKPIKVNLSSADNHLGRFEALFDCNTPKHVDVDLKREHVPIAMRKYLPKFETVKLHTSDLRPVAVLRETLQIFISQYLPSIKLFNFLISGDLDSKNRLEQEFRDLNWSHTADGSREGIAATVQLPQHFPPESLCKIVVDWNARFQPVTVWFNIHYTIGGEMATE